jgi:hypothetical protein
MLQGMVPPPTAPLAASASAVALLLLLCLGCAGATAVEVVPPLAEADDAVLAGAADTGLDEVPTQDQAPADEAPADEVPAGDDGVAAADPEPDRRPNSAPASPKPAPPPAAGAGEEEPPGDDGAEKKARHPPAPAPSGISQVNGTTWQVQQRLVDRWQADPYTLGNVRESGAGWELIGIRQRNAYHLGMRNSDIVLEVNGKKLNTMPQLLAAYLALKNDKSFDVVFLRRGAQKVHHYRIVE